MNISPSLVRKNTCELKEYPRFSFQDNDDTYYVVKGRRVMAELIKIEYEFQEQKKIIGYQKQTDFQHAGQMWQEYFSNGFSEKVKEIENYNIDVGIEYISLGYMRNFDDTGQAFEYTIGKYFEKDTIVPKGLTEAIEKNGYKIDYDNFYWCDVYTYDGYCSPIEKGEEIIVLDYYMPCIK